MVEHLAAVASVQSIVQVIPPSPVALGAAHHRRHADRRRCRDVASRLADDPDPWIDRIQGARGSARRIPRWSARRSPSRHPSRRPGRARPAPQDSRPGSRRRYPAPRAHGRARPPPTSAAGRRRWPRRAFAGCPPASPHGTRDRQPEREARRRARADPAPLRDCSRICATDRIPRRRCGTPPGSGSPRGSCASRICAAHPDCRSRNG